MTRPTFLIISQVYVPDPASVGQHIADAAAEMARRGYRVVVYASARGYDDPSRRYPARETLDGVDVRRLPLSSFGKGSIAVRLFAQAIFMLQAVLRGIFTRNLAAVMVSTSPPFCGIGGVLISMLRGVPLKYWLMDLNPDQMIAMKKIGPRSLPARVFNAFNRATYARSSDIVVLDRFMAQRVTALSLGVEGKLTIMPPWSHEEPQDNLPHEQNDFRREHGLADKFVVMYSGNHSPANPIATLLDAAESLAAEPRLVVMCIGGGAGKQDVERRIARGATNIRSLPYQPLSRLRYSLSAADVHVVSIGNDVVGIVHPCKVYGAMAVSRPILFLGPTPSHVSDLVGEHDVGWQVAHGDVDACRRALLEMLSTPQARLAEMGARAQRAVAGTLGKRELLRRYCDTMQRGVRPPGPEQAQARAAGPVETQP